MRVVYFYLVAAGIFTIIDSIWIAIVANNFYKSQIGHLLAAKPNFIAAVIFYLIYIFAIVFFVVNPAVNQGYGLAKVVGSSALLGFAMYATYDLTNHATLKNWPLSMTLVDMLWGTILTASVATITYLIFR